MTTYTLTFTGLSAEDALALINKCSRCDHWLEPSHEHLGVWELWGDKGRGAQPFGLINLESYEAALVEALRMLADYYEYDLDEVHHAGTL